LNRGCQFYWWRRSIDRAEITYPCYIIYLATPGTTAARPTLVYGWCFVLFNTYLQLCMMMLIILFDCLLYFCLFCVWLVNLKCDVFRWSGRNTSNWFLYLKCYQCDIIFLIKLRTRWLKICILEHVLRNCLINLWYMTIQTHRQSLGIRHRTNKNTTSNQKGLWASSCIAVDMCWIKQNINHTPVSDVPR
jgi:hypothetical protein